MSVFVRLHQVSKDLVTFVNVSNISFIEADGGGSLIHLRSNSNAGRMQIAVTESPDEIMRYITEE